MAYYKTITINGTKYSFECAIEGEGAPASTVEANVGQFYIDTFTAGNPIYWCTGKTNGATQWARVANYADINSISDVDIASIINEIS